MAVAVGVASAMLMVVSFMAAPRAAASGCGNLCVASATWTHRWYAGAQQVGTAYGVSALLSVPAPGVPIGEYESLVRIAVGTPDGQITVEAGFIKAPWLWGDNAIHLYAGTRNGANACYVADPIPSAFNCGWFSTSATRFPGMTVPNKMSPQAFDIHFQASPAPGLWIVRYQGENIGLFAQSISFPDLAIFDINPGNGRVEWYGQVNTNSVPPCTAMGTGVYGTQAGAATITGMSVEHSDATWSQAAATQFATNPRLFNVGAFTQHSLSYGGPISC